MRTARAMSNNDTRRSAARTPGTGLKRATSSGQVAAPIPQQKLSAPSADAARWGVRRATIMLVAGTTNPMPTPETAIASVPATRSPSARPAKPAAISAYPVASVALAPSRATIRPERAPATMPPVNWIVKSAPAAASESCQRAESHGSTGPRTVVTKPVMMKPVKRSGRPLGCESRDSLMSESRRRAAERGLRTIRCARESQIVPQTTSLAHVDIRPELGRR